MEIVGKPGPSVSENEPVLGSLVLRDWRFQVKDASLGGTVQPIGPAGPVSPSVGRWFPKLRGKRRRPLPTEWSFTWHLEITTERQQDRKDPDSFTWEPRAYGDLPVQCYDWRKFDELHVTWKGAPDNEWWLYHSNQPFRVECYEAWNVTENNLLFTLRRGAVFHLRWEGIMAMNWNEEWNKDSPFAFLVDTEVEFVGISAMALDHEVEATQEQLRRLAEETELKELPAEISEDPPHIQKITGSRYTTRMRLVPK